jgi:ABC-type Na+ efflux pump permease subunit
MNNNSQEKDLTQKTPSAKAVAKMKYVQKLTWFFAIPFFLLTPLLAREAVQWGISKWAFITIGTVVLALLFVLTWKIADKKFGNKNRL